MILKILKLWRYEKQYITVGRGLKKFDAIPKIFSNKVYSVFEEKIDSLIDVALAVS
ncbi:MAG: hypothetical protein QXR84_09370 [Candidatus Bathyarchaeia archaeon]